MGGEGVMRHLREVGVEGVMRHLRWGGKGG